MKKNTTTIYLLLLITFTGFSQNFQYLGTYSSNGTPNYLVTPGDNISVSTFELIDSALSETFQVPTYNPHYITSGYDTDLVLLSQSEVFVTFVSEGAGFRNVLGYYTYDAANPITSPPLDADITIIFPNASRLGSGGGLLPGDKVSLGVFPAGTAIGWVLISNGWNGNSVGYGYWKLFSNPDFNPESNVSKRQHNVLIKDDANELIVLGFEDINREMSWCDHDFNDALFYVTASSYNNMKTVNNINIESSTNVFSSNLGGFESNGDLSEAIAARNMNRLKNKNYPDKKQRQAKFDKMNFKNANSLGNYFPETGMGSNEFPHIATSSDLINYANADDAFSLDYYLGVDRVSAALVTTTTNRIYDHSKSICDRLNGSILKDTRPVTLSGHEMIFAIIEKPDGNNEYAISFSIREDVIENELLSFWNIGAYPVGNFKNFQVWGVSMGQVCHIVNHILAKLEEEKTLISYSQVERVPSVFVSSAYYRNQQLHLNIINKVEATSITMNANLRRTEQMDTESISQQIALSGDYYQTIVIDTGFLFDIGVALIYQGSSIYDALYLADGSWGIDYDVPEQTNIDHFDIVEQIDILDESVYDVERAIDLQGSIYGTCNVFRNFLPGDLTLDAANYTGLSFVLSSNTVIEVSIVPDNLDDWNNRYTFTVPSTDGISKNIEIPFEMFSNLEGVYQGIDNLRTVIFSIRGNYTSSINAALNISKVSLGIKPVSTFASSFESLINYPNPFTGETTIVVPEETESIVLKVYDVLGRPVYNEILKTNDDKRSVVFSSDNLSNGAYLYEITTSSNKVYSSKFIVN